MSCKDHMDSLAEVVDIPAIPLKLFLALLDYDVDDNGNSTLWQPAINHHGLNANSKGYPSLEKAVFKCLDEGKSTTLNSAMSCLLFQNIQSAVDKDKIKNATFVFRSNTAKASHDSQKKEGYKIVDHGLAVEFMDSIKNDESFMNEILSCSTLIEVQDKVSYSRLYMKSYFFNTVCECGVFEPHRISLTFFVCDPQQSPITCCVEQMINLKPIEWLLVYVLCLCVCN